MSWTDGSARVGKSLAWRQGKRGCVEERRNAKEQSLHTQDQMRVPRGSVWQDGKRGMMGNSLGVRAEARSCFLGCRQPCSCCLGSLPPEPEQAGNPTVAAGGWRKESEGVPFLLLPFHTDQFCSFPNKYLTLNKQLLPCLVFLQPRLASWLKSSLWPRDPPP